MGPKTHVVTQTNMMHIEEIKVDGFDANGLSVRTGMIKQASEEKAALGPRSLVKAKEKPSQWVTGCQGWRM